MVFSVVWCVLCLSFVSFCCSWFCLSSDFTICVCPFGFFEFLIQSISISQHNKKTGKTRDINTPTYLINLPKITNKLNAWPLPIRWSVQLVYLITQQENVIRSIPDGQTRLTGLTSENIENNTSCLHRFPISRVKCRRMSLFESRQLFV